MSNPHKGGGTLTKGIQRIEGKVETKEDERSLDEDRKKAQFDSCLHAYGEGDGETNAGGKIAKYYEKG